MNFELIETEDLIEELFKRYEHAAFMGLRDRGSNDLLEIHEMHGNSRTVQGLLIGMLFKIQADLEDRTERYDGIG